MYAPRLRRKRLYIELLVGVSTRGVEAKRETLVGERRGWFLRESLAQIAATFPLIAKQNMCVDIYIFISDSHSYIYIRHTPTVRGRPWLRKHGTAQRRTSSSQLPLERESKMELGRSPSDIFPRHSRRTPLRRGYTLLARREISFVQFTLRATCVSPVLRCPPFAYGLNNRGDTRLTLPITKTVTHFFFFCRLLIFSVIELFI